MTTVTEVAGMLAVKGADGPWLAKFALDQVANMKRLGHGLETKMALKAEPPYFAMFVLEPYRTDPDIAQTPTLFKYCGKMLDTLISIAHDGEVHFGNDMVSELLTHGYKVGVFSNLEKRGLPEGIPQQFVCFYNDEARVNFCLTMQQQGLE